MIDEKSSDADEIESIEQLENTENLIQNETITPQKEQKQQTHYLTILK